MREKAGKEGLGSAEELWVNKACSGEKRQGTHNGVKDISDGRIIKLTGKKIRDGDGGWQ